MYTLKPKILLNNFEKLCFEKFFDFQLAIKSTRNMKKKRSVYSNWLTDLNKQIIDEMICRHQ